jgi:hypothetical protein
MLGVGEVDVQAIHWHAWQIRLYAHHGTGRPARGLRPAIRSSKPLDAQEMLFRAELDEHPERRLPATDLECRAAGLGDDIPCPFVSCRHHIGVAITTGGSLQVIYPHWEDGAEEDVPTCSLAYARLGEHTAAECGELLGIGETRVSQIIVTALRKLQALIE